jgi:hypothetical protein
MPPDTTGAHARPGNALITTVARRRLLVHAGWAAAAGLVLAALVWTTMRAYGVPSVIAIVTASTAVLLVSVLALWRTAGQRSRYEAARAIETACPDLRNVLVTAEELERHPRRAAPAIAARVFDEADRVTSRVRAAEVVPVRGASLGVATAVMIVLAVTWIPEWRAPSAGALAPSSEDVSSPLAAGSVRFTVVPPAYSELATITLTDPERIVALEGSRVRVETSAGERARFGEDVVDEIVARASGYFAIERDADALRLVPLTVTPDRAPSVRVEAPGKDMLLPDGSRTIPVTITASDDLALSALELRFTRVSGSGEQFEFVEGSLPVDLARPSSREWRGEGRLTLPAMNLGPGDSIVYRAVARDRRPGDAGLASSDTYMLEIAGPGQVALEGVEMPPELERYAMSQQMIVLKLERLRAKEAGLTLEALTEEAASIAAEQRTVRANFIFLLGGHVEDEFEEAEHSHEIQEGRLENTARQDINAAISQMTRVGEGLAALNVAAALPPARAAVESLQRAFGRSRYLLRALASRSRLDPSRRLTGALADASDWRRTVPDPEERDGLSVRALLDRVLETLSSSRATGSFPDRDREALAEAALAIDPAAEPWQLLARRLLDADDAQALESIAGELAARALEGTVTPSGVDTGTSALVRAYRSERRR